MTRLWALVVALAAATSAGLAVADLEVIAQAQQPAATARPLTERGLANVVAFAKLFGYVRHFYPGDEAANGDWSAIAVAGMRAVEGAATPEALVRELEGIFKPMAPAVSIGLTGASLAAPAPASGSGSRLVTWRHLGFGTSNTASPYRSERLTPATPPAPFEADLGGGVRVRVPLAVPGGTGGARPAPRPGDRLSANDRAVRLAAIAVAWNVFQHFYPYFDVVRTDWAAVLPAALQQAAIDRDASEFLSTLTRLTALIHDGQAGATAADDADGFIPAVALDWVEGRLVVAAAADGTGLQIGDAIAAVDGMAAPLALEARESTVSGATPQWIRVRALQHLLQGPRGSQVRIRVERFATPQQRDEIALTRSVKSYAAPPLRAAIAEPRPGILYVDLTRLSDRQMRDALSRLSKASGIVFDVRGTLTVNPETVITRLADRPLTGPQWLMPQITRPDRQQVTYVKGPEWALAPATPVLRAKTAFLADARTIGAAESFLMIVDQYRPGDIVGSATAGTTGLDNHFDVPGGYTVSFTGMKVLKHDGSQHHGIGIKPTVPVARSRAAVASGRDEPFDRAIEWVAIR